MTMKYDDDDVVILDKETNMRCVKIPCEKINYLISMMAYPKASIELVKEAEDMLMKINLSPSCDVHELTKIIDLFTKYFYSKNPDINGILMLGEENPLLTNIGFNPLNEESDYLYQKNPQKVKGGRGQK